MISLPSPSTHPSQPHKPLCGAKEPTIGHRQKEMDGRIFRVARPTFFLPRTHTAEKLAAFCRDIVMQFDVTILKNWPQKLAARQENLPQIEK